MSESNGGGTRSTSGLVAALLVAGVVVACLVVALIGSFSGTRGPVSVPSTVRPSSTSGPSSVCGLPGLDAKSSLVTAPSTSWTLVGLMAAPTDRGGSGPGIVERDGFRSCYAHTAAGALFAVANYTALDTDPRLAPQIPSKLLAPGSGRDAQLDAGAPGTGANYRFQISGFAIRAYTRERAVVDLAATSSDGRLLSLPVEIVWSGGDWKIVTLPSGVLPYTAATLKNLAGYIPWSGA
ncbi:MAG: hypothetical protein V4479_11220 [Actinomycetota bacterium]